MTGVLIRRRLSQTEIKGKYRREEGHVNMEGEAGVMPSEAKEL